MRERATLATAGGNANAVDYLLEPVLPNQSLNLLRSHRPIGSTSKPGLHNFTQSLRTARRSSAVCTRLACVRMFARRLSRPRRRCLYSLLLL